MGFFSILRSSIRLGVEAFILVLLVIMQFMGVGFGITVRKRECIITVLLITFIPGLPPDAKISEPYKVTKANLEGKLAFNNKLDDVEILFKDQMHGPESLTDDNGSIYTSLHMGDVVKVVGKHIIPIVKFGKPCKGVYQEGICGRPLGLTFGPDGHLYVADAYYGIFKVDVKTGDKKQLVSFGQEIEGRKVKLANSLDVTCNGDVYWTDSSTDFTLQDGVFTLLADPSGRLIHYNAKTGKNKVLIDNLHFANGVKISKNEDFVLVAETGRNRIQRYFIKGPKMSSSDIFVDGLPGMPDNIQTDGDAHFLVSLAAEAHSKHPLFFHIFSQFPNVRKFFARSLALMQLAFKTIDNIYPNEFSQKGFHFVGHLEPVSGLMPGRGAVLHISANGEILDCLWSSNKTISAFSEAHIIKDHLYLGSPFNKYLGRIPLSKIGWEHLKQKTDTLSSTIKRCRHEAEVDRSTTTTTSRPTTSTTPRPTTTTTSKPTTTTPKPTAVPTATTTKPSVASPKPAAEPKPSVTTPKPTATTPKPAAATPKPTTSTKKPAVTTKASADVPKASPVPVKPETNTPKPAQVDQVKKVPPAVKEPKVVQTAQKASKSEDIPESSGHQGKVKSDSKEPKTRTPKNEL